MLLFIILYFFNTYMKGLNKRRENISIKITMNMIKLLVIHSSSFIPLIAFAHNPYLYQSILYHSLYAYSQDSIFLTNHHMLKKDLSNNKRKKEDLLYKRFLYRIHLVNLSNPYSISYLYHLASQSDHHGNEQSISEEIHNNTFFHKL